MAEDATTGSDARSLASRAADDWSRAVRPQLVPGVTTYEEYLIRTSVGLYRAAQQLRTQLPVIPTLHELDGLHSVAFGSALVHAGHRRRPEDLRVHDGTIAPETTRVLREYERLAAEMNHLAATAKAPWETAAAIAYYHARLIGIRPYKDGNKRLALQVTQNQLEHLLGKRPPGFISEVRKNETLYREAIATALTQDNLLPLTRIMAAAHAIELPAQVHQLPARARVAARVADSVADVLPLAEELARAGKSPTWAANVLQTLKVARLNGVEGKDSPAALTISETRLLVQLREVRDARSRGKDPISPADAANAARELVARQTGPDLSDAGIEVRGSAEKFVLGEMREEDLRWTLRRHILALQRSLPGDGTRESGFVFGRAFASKELNPVFPPIGPQHPLGRDFLAELRGLREVTLGTDIMRQKAALSDGRELVGLLAGSGITSVPLRSAVERYLRGELAETDVTRRLEDHLKRNPTLKERRVADLRQEQRTKGRALVRE